MKIGAAIDVVTPRSRSASTTIALPGPVVSCGDLAGLAGATELDMRVAIAMADWSPTASQTLITQGSNSAANSAFRWYLVVTTGALRIDISDNSAYSTLGGSTATLAARSDGELLSVRVTWRASDGRTQHFWRSGSSGLRSNIGWTQLGSDVTVSRPALIDSSAAVRVGINSSGQVPATGVLHGATIATTIDGVPIADLDPALFAGGASYVDAYGTTWTIS